MTTKQAEEPPYKLIVSWDAKVVDIEAPLEETIKILESQSIISDKPFDTNMCSQIPMTFIEEGTVVLLWLTLFGLMLYGPFLFIYGLIYHRYYTTIISIALISITFIPTKFNKNSCKGWLSSLLLKYFSYRGLWNHYIPTDKPSILVVPPHGLFPFGSILGLLSVPRTANRFLYHYTTIIIIIITIIIIIVT